MVVERSDRLRESGISIGSRVVVAHGQSAAFFADLFALWSLGACAACVDPDLTEGELENVNQFLDAPLVLTGSNCPGPGTEMDLCSDNRKDEPAGVGGLLIKRGEGEPALILFTSGTTGDPKGVVHTFGSLAARLKENRKRISPETLRRTLCVLPTHFGHGLIGNCLTPLLAGADLFLGEAGVHGAARLGTVLSKHQITFMSSVPSFWKIALKMSPKPEASSLRQVSVGSAPVSATLVEEIMAWGGVSDVRNMYGITETANWVAGSSTLDRPAEDGLIGTMWGGDVAVRLADGTLSSEGEGELALRPPSLMSGYFRRPDLTAEVMKEGWFFTGDTGSIDGQGIMRLTGRIKNEINRGGIKVSPEEVDLLLEKHPGVAEACAFGLPDPVAGETVGIAIKAMVGEALRSQELRSWCLQRIRRECIPERWFFLEEIPKTGRGKLNRDIVRFACLEGGT